MYNLYKKYVSHLIETDIYILNANLLFMQK